jgi:hypothetical protein
MVQRDRVHAFRRSCEQALREQGNVTPGSLAKLRKACFAYASRLRVNVRLEKIRRGDMAATLAEELALESTGQRADESMDKALTAIGLTGAPPAPDPLAALWAVSPGDGVAAEVSTRPSAYEPSPTVEIVDPAQSCATSDSEQTETADGHAPDPGVSGSDEPPSCRRL